MIHTLLGFTAVVGEALGLVVGIVVSIHTSSWR